MQVCPNCGFENRIGIVFCENCGSSLVGSESRGQTQFLETKKLDEDAPVNEALLELIESELELGAQEFPAEGKIRFEMVGSEPIIMAVEHPIKLGRRDPSTGSTPDVDLTTQAGYRMGVSRLHAEIRPNPKDSALELWDLGSSNGTYLNGERLVSHRSYRLRHGDTVRCGQLAIRVFFQTN